VLYKLELHKYLLVDCSGGLAYSEWRRFKKQLKILPDIFDMEKKLNQYIFVGDLQGKTIIGLQYAFVLERDFHNLPITSLAR